VRDVQPQLGSLAWSPDGSRLAFAATLGGTFEILTVQADGSGLRRLTDNAAYDDIPMWSPDGGRVTFVSDRGRTSSIPNFKPQDIYVMNADGSGQTRLNAGAEFEQAYSSAPAWSPDGRRIAFYSEGPNGSAIYVIGADGANRVKLASGPGSVSRPAWSPDGRMVAFYALVADKWELQVINADGSGQRRLTDQDVAPPTFERPVAWSPDSRLIAFVAQKASGSEVSLINADGTGLAPLLRAQQPEGDVLFIGWPVWAPR
jgi:TolB protein